MAPDRKKKSKSQARGKPRKQRCRIRNEVEPSGQKKSPEGSTQRLSAQYFRPILQVIYHNSVEHPSDIIGRFDEPASNVVLLKVIEDILSPFLDGEHERLVDVHEFRGNIFDPSQIRGMSLGEGLVVIDLEKLLFELMSLAEQWIIPGPGFQEKELLRGQIVLATKEQKADMHIQRFPLGLGDLGTHLLTKCL